MPYGGLILYSPLWVQKTKRVKRDKLFKQWIDAGYQTDINGYAFYLVYRGADQIRSGQGKAMAFNFSSSHGSASPTAFEQQREELVREIAVVSFF